MPETIWCYEQKEKSLDVMSRDFFASGTNTLVLLPNQEKLFDKEFLLYISFVLEHLTLMGQDLTVIGACKWPKFNHVSKISGTYAFESMPHFKVKRRDFLGRFSIQDESKPTLEKAGLVTDLLDCDNVVLIGKIHNSARFGISLLLSLVDNVLPTLTLSQAYMLNPKGNMQRAFAEIIHAKLCPKVSLSVGWNRNGVVLGKDMVAVESASLYNSGLNVRGDKLLLESARLGFGDIFFTSCNIVGQFSGSKPEGNARLNVKPRWMKQKCNLCMDCINACPNGSISANNNNLTIGQNCVRCGACADACNVEALI